MASADGSGTVATGVAEIANVNPPMPGVTCERTLLFMPSSRTTPPSGSPLLKTVPVMDTFPETRVGVMPKSSWPSSGGIETLSVTYINADAIGWSNVKSKVSLPT